VAAPPSATQDSTGRRVRGPSRSLGNIWRGGKDDGILGGGLRNRYLSHLLGHLEITEDQETMKSMARKPDHSDGWATLGLIAAVLILLCLNIGGQIGNWLGYVIVTGMH
jgi:hypothetical protein